MPFSQTLYSPQLGLYTNEAEQQQPQNLRFGLQPWQSTSQASSGWLQEPQPSSPPSVPPRRSSLQPAAPATAAEMTTMAAQSSAQAPYFAGNPHAQGDPSMQPASSMGWTMPSTASTPGGAGNGGNYHFSMAPSSQFGHMSGVFGHRRSGTEPNMSEGANAAISQGAHGPIPWQASPRSNLKRSGDDLWDQGQLRRPASFPALAAQAGTNDEARYAPQQQYTPQAPGAGQQHPQLARSQTFHRIPNAAAGGNADTLSMHRPVIDASHFNYMHQSSPAQRGMNLGNSALSRGEMTPAFSTISSLPSTSPSSSVHRRESSFAFNVPADEASQYVEAAAYPSKAPPAQYQDNASTPQLMRATQVYAPSHGTSTPGGGGMPGGHSHSLSMSSSNSSPPGGSASLATMPHLSQRAHLELHGNVHDMALGWSHDEWRSRRRLVQFWRKQEGTKIHAICKPILPEQYVPNSVVVSCIFWDVTNECYITSVDIIYLLEALVASRFNVEEKNRIRRNLEGLKPKTISKQPKNVDENLNRIHDEFFKLVMSFPNPKPRHIEKDIKIFPWRTVPAALNKIISKYSAAPLMAAAADQPSSFTSVSNIGSAHSTPVPGEASSFGTPTPGQGPWPPKSSHGQFAQPPAQQQQQQQQQQQAMRRMNPNLSIDVDASNGGNPVQVSAPASQGMYNGIGGIASYAPLSGRTLTSPSGFFNLPQPSPRRAQGSLGLGSGGTVFNINDFVVSPSAFAQTPLHPMQGQGQGGPSGGMVASEGAQQPREPEGAGGQSSAVGGAGLGVNLGHHYK